MFCSECGVQISDNAAICPKCGTAIASKQVAANGEVKSHMVAAVLQLIVFPPAGIVPLIYACKVNSKLAKGDVSGACEASKKARFWINLGTAIIVVLIILMMVSNNKRETQNTRLKPSGMSCIEFKATRPNNGAVFKAMIKLSDRYYGKIRNYKDDFWSVEISLLGENEHLCGYVYKDSDCGREIFEATRSGARVNCLVLVKSLNDYMTDLVLIEDFCAFDD